MNTKLRIMIVLSCCRSIAFPSALPPPVPIPAATYNTQVSLLAPYSLLPYKLTQHNHGALPSTFFFSPSGNFLAESSAQSSYTDTLSNAASTITGSARELISPSTSVLSTLSSAGGLGSSIATLEYSFEILGPTTSVPIAITADGIISSSAVSPDLDWNEEVLFNLTLPEFIFPIFQDYAIIDALPKTAIRSASSSEALVGSSSTGYSDGFSEDGIYTLNTNTIYSADMTASLFSESGKISLSASVDPMISIANSVPDASAYQILFSSGISNSVPDATLNVFELSGGFVFILLFSRFRPIANRCLFVSKVAK